MDFDLPDTVFLRIFDYLPLVDRFRVGRVSQSFNKISQIVNARIKWLNLGDPMFVKLDLDQFEVILRLCNHNLQEIVFPRENGRGMAAKFSQFTCPQLIDLDLRCSSITNDEFARIVSNHPNLKSLKWGAWHHYVSGFHVEFPPVTLPHLETLHIQCLNDATLEHLIDRCPNLKTLEMGLDQASSEDVWDRFFRSVPRLESLRLDLYDCRILMENLEWFWRLPLTSLSISYPRKVDEFMVNDDFVNKLIENFTNIEHLNLQLTDASDDTVVALTRLEKLRKVRLDVTNTEITGEALREFSACGHLEEMDVWSTYLSRQTLLHLFSNCPRLQQLYLSGVDNNDDEPIDADTAGMLLSELANIPHRPSITFEFYPIDDETSLAWESIQVQNAVQNLMQNHGIEMNIRVN